MSDKVIIKLHDWHYQCGDRCCDEYGCEIRVNGELCDNGHAGDDVEQSIAFVLTQLGIEFEIEHTYYGEE